MRNYNSENDVFLQHFDENGNFIESKPEALIDETSANTEEKPIKIKYFFKKDTKDSDEKL